MVVGNNESTTTTNADESLTISMAMAMQQYDAGHIAQWSTSRASLEANRCHHRASACAVSPRRLPWSTNSNKTHKTLTKHNLYVTFWALYSRQYKTRYFLEGNRTIFNNPPFSKTCVVTSRLTNPTDDHNLACLLMLLMMTRRSSKSYRRISYAVS